MVTISVTISVCVCKSVDSLTCRLCKLVDDGTCCASK